MKEYNFSKNYKARKILIVAICCLFIICSAFSSLTVYADSNTPLLDLYDVPSEFISADGSGFPFMPSNLNENGYDYNYYTNAYEQSIAQNYFCVPTSSVISVENYPHYCMCSNSEDMKFYVLPEDSFIVGNSTPFNNGGGSFVFYVNRDSIADSLLYDYKFVSTIPPTYDFWNYKQNESFNYNDIVNIDGELYYRTYLNSTLNCRGYILNTDLPCYYDADLTIDSLEGLDDVNPDSNSGGSDTSNETAENNLYFKDCDISYSCSGNQNGNIVCQAKLTDYQKEHLDEFLVVYNFTFDVKGYQVNSNDNQSVLGNKVEFSKNYAFQQTLSDFYNNSSSKVFTLKDIEQNINTTDIDSEYGNLYQLFTYLNNNMSSSGDITEFLPFKYIKCSLKTTMFVTLADVNLDNLTNNNIRSGSYSESYNFVKGTSSLNSDGILNNSNPVQTNSSGTIDSNEELAGLTTQGGITGNDMPSSNNGNGNGNGSYSGDNNIIINNNPTFNNNSSGSGSDGSFSQSGGSPSNSGLFSTLVDFVKGDTESTSDSISELVDTDGWISVINSYYTFIPEQFWTLLFAVMGTCIGIMVVAFIISIVLRFIS